MKKYKLTVKEQEFSFEDIPELKNKVKALMDCGIWLIETEGIKDDTPDDIEDDIKEKLDKMETPGYPKSITAKRKRRKKAEMIADIEQTKGKSVQKKRTYLGYTDEVNDFIEKNWKNNQDKELVVLIKNKFNREYTTDQIKSHRKQYGWVASKPGRKDIEGLTEEKKRTNQRYPDEMKGFIERHVNTTTNQQLCDLINEKFDVGITATKLNPYMNYKGIKRNKKPEEEIKKMGKPKKYTDEAVQFLRENINNFSHKELCDELESQFNIKTNPVKLAAILWQKGIKRDSKTNIDPEIIEFIKKSKTNDAFALRDNIIEEFEVNIDVPEIRKHMVDSPKESVEEEVNRVKKLRRELMDNENDIDEVLS